MQGAGLNVGAATRAVIKLVGTGAPEKRPLQGLTPRCRRIIGIAAEEARRLGASRVGTEHLLMGILREGEGTAVRVLAVCGAEAEELCAELSDAGGLSPFYDRRTAGEPERRQEREYTERGVTKLLEQYARDLTRLAAAGALDPVIGRDREVSRVIQILCRRQKNNPALIGEPGVGKTAVAGSPTP